MGDPQNGWFTRENPIEIDDNVRGTPILGNLHIIVVVILLQEGAPKIAKLPHKWLKMVDITIVTGSYFMVYKPTSISGGVHLVVMLYFVEENIHCS